MLRQRWSRNNFGLLVLIAAMAVAPGISGCAGYAEAARPGLSLTPQSLSLTSAVGKSSSQTVVVSNIGNITINILQASVTGAGFSASNLAVPLSLTPGQSTEIAVKFVPSSAQTVNGTLSLMTDHHRRPIVANLYGNGAGSNSPVTSVAVTPAAASLAANGKVQFATTIQGTATNQAVTWTASTGNITANGLYTAPAAAGTGIVTATSVADPTKSAAAPVTITATPNPNPPPSNPSVSSVTISPASTTTATGGVLDFSASVTGSAADKLVTWKAVLGTITSAGIYTAPSKAGTDLVTSTSIADPSKSASATVTVTAPPRTPSPTVSSVIVSPTSASASAGTTLRFSASVQGTASDKSVTWRALVGTVTSAGVYTAPAKSGVDVVTATSNADANKFASASVTITNAPTPPPPPTVSSIAVSPTSTSASASSTLHFSASVQGTVADKSVTWRAVLGTITSSGTYTAPSRAGSDTVTATSNADGSKSASATITITAAPTPPPATVSSVTVSPASAATSAGGTLQFTASVQGTVTDKSVSWRASIGTISASGQYTAPAKGGSDTVTASSNADTSKFATATVAVSAPAPPPPPPPPTGNGISLLTFGNAGFGGDDTSVFQTALNSTAGNGQVLEVPAGNYNISPINLPANANLKLDSGVTVSANSGFGSSDRMLNVNANNVTITGAGNGASVFQMPKARAASQGDGSQYRHCLGIQNASNVTVTGISCNQSGGDGIYINAATNVTVSNCIFDGNFRDGGSVIGQLNHVNLNNNVFSNTQGSAPQAGVDVEPNVPGDFLTDVNFTDNTMLNNAGDGLAISLWTLTSSSQAVSLTVTRNHSDHNGRYGYFANNNDPSNAPGAITLNDCTTDQSGSDGANARFYAANGASLTFNNLTVTNPHRNGPDPSYGDSVAVAIIRGGGASVPEGNVHYRNVNVTVTNGNVDYYFDFHDGANIGVSNVTFTPGTLSGASQAPPNGLLSGQTANSVGN